MFINIRNRNKNNMYSSATDEEKKSKRREYLRLRAERIRNESGTVKYTRGPYNTKYDMNRRDTHTNKNSDRSDGTNDTT